MAGMERVLNNREQQIRDMTPAQQAFPATRGDIQNLERTIINAARYLAETIMKARY